MLNKEIEKKWLLTRAQYDCLLSKYASSLIDTRIQINYYYDTENFDFYNCNETVRVRQIDEMMKLQIKFNKFENAGINISNEYQRDIPFLPQTITVKKFKTKFVGNLITLRHKVKFKDCIMFIDKNYYLGKIDYELEIEASREKCASIDLPYDNNVQGKYSRFVQELNALKKQIAMINY